MPKITLELDRRTIIGLRSLALERGILQTRGPNVGQGNVSGLLDALMRARRRVRHVPDAMDIDEWFDIFDPHIEDLCQEEFRGDA